ncbi:hypothetical protein M422DRAFT_74805 [Sphaerobolus stellatus SS14]|uniref:Autophagy-related protein n=1 Tax=Sphaerobolus stellatus (strain SS14) TaxID=990650 RepID=A0A0C9VW24_SPHS4|nr:hypothetical protein M422DRAFT_74805 [Sphaerobolus stellatus SS14]
MSSNSPKPEATVLATLPKPSKCDELARSNVDVKEVPGSPENPLSSSLVDKEGPIVTRRELWAYYSYYNGDNGVGPYGYSVTLFQSLATQAAFDSSLGPDHPCTAGTSSSKCHLSWGKGTKSVSSIVLIANGICFAIMTALFTTIGSAADYGSFGRWLLLGLTIICWGAQFASMNLTTPDRWGLAMALFMISFVSYGATIVFYSAAFPRLARNTSHSRRLKEKLDQGQISEEDYEIEESLEKNRISNISNVHGNIGYFTIQALNLSLLIPLQNNPKVDDYVVVLTTAYWVITGIWWFIFQQPRPGPKLPKGESYLTIGWKQFWNAGQEYRKLPYTFIYLFAFFLLADGFSTTGTLLSICQNDQFESSFLQNTYLGGSQALASILSTFSFWHIQKHWKINTKNMFVVTNVATILIPLWGMMGLWTNKFGFYNVWEFWAYNIFSGLFQAPYYAFSQTMMAELTPPGFDNMFFGLFGLSNRASSIIGPIVIQAIINRTQNNWQGFPFLFALCTVASLVIWFGVDVQKGRRDALSGWTRELQKST